MKIINKGRGVHERELVGIEKLRSLLPEDWVAFTNLELATAGGRGREIDVILIIEDRILAVDLKDWRGPIRSEDGFWKQGSNVSERSPVEKILRNKRDLSIRLQQFLQEDAKRKGQHPQSVDVPTVHAFVVLTSCKDRSQIASTEQECVSSIDPFIKMLRNKQLRIEKLGGVPPVFHTPGLTSAGWMSLLGRFFNVDTGIFRVSSRFYGSYQAVTDQHCYQHPSKVFTEYDVEDPAARSATGLLRRWDFTKAEVHFQSENGRKEIAGRERSVIAWLNDRNSGFETAVLQPRVDDAEVSVGYWEVFDRRRKLRRLLDDTPTGFRRLSPELKAELTRQILAQARMLHDIGAAHLDLGMHSIWTEPPSTVKLSHLMAASFPDLQTLGDRRYQFLSSARVPEQLLGVASAPQRRDVYQLGSIIHHLYFGVPPGGEPGEWSPSVDATNAMSQLHPWFARALDLDPKGRFIDAGDMLAEFNKALSTDRSAAEVISGLDRFRTIPSQRHLFKEYPEVRELQEDARVTVWESVKDDTRLVVKLWKREGWGDQTKESARILDFLESAHDLIEQPIPGFARVRGAHWLGDAIALVLDYVDGTPLDQVIADQSGLQLTTQNRLSILRSLVAHIDGAHQRQIAHGDLKPANILVQAAKLDDPVLVDYMDFCPESDGERLSGAYAPPEGGRFERDRFAICRIVEEFLASETLPSSYRERIDTALLQTRQGPPPNASLVPLTESFAHDPHEPPKAPVRMIRVGCSSEEVGLLLPDEGSIFFRLAPHKRLLFVRGACEQLIVTLDEAGKPVGVRRKHLDQKRIGSGGRFEIPMSGYQLEVVASPADSFAELEALLAEPDIRQSLWKDSNVTAPSPSGQPEVDAETADVDEDEEIEEIASADQERKAYSVDVPLLWKQSIDVESELPVEAVATGDSAFRPLSRRHVAPFQMEAGEFDFDKEDTVIAARFDGGTRWVKLGVVDVVGTRAGYVQIDASRAGFRPVDTIIQEGNRIRFSSHFEETSRSRRRFAVDRILQGQSRIPDLIKVFSGAPDAPSRQITNDIDVGALKEEYGLNEGQVDAFRTAISNRPLSLLQGPPGTGKTRFIGAVIHYAIKNGLARNVLVASQSHEAVNGAAESILRYFANDNAPSILRVGHEGNVSEALMPFHVATVEASLKNRFRGEFRERITGIGEGMGLPRNFCDEVLHIETVAAPASRRLLELLSGPQEDAARINGIIDTLRAVTTQFDHDLDPRSELFIENLCMHVAASAGIANATLVARFRDVIRIGGDFINSVSTRTRNFEGFLAGTRQVVAGTCVGLGRTSLGLVSTSFDLVIVDEAARCTAGELAVPMQAGRWVILVGDHHQLEPMIKKRTLEALSEKSGLPQKELLRSDFERIFERPGTGAPRRTLTTQYRMLPPIGSLVSDAFYKVGLKHGRTDPLIPPESLPPFLSHTLTWLTTDEFGADGYQRPPKARPKSLENVREADLIVGAIQEWDQHESFRDWLEHQRLSSHVIGIICTYAAQAELIRSKLRSSYVSETMRRTIKIDTVDSYQGKENPIVILSLVRNNNDGNKEGDRVTIAPGFMFRPNRINVAMSRAMDRLIIVGASNGWSLRGPMGRVTDAFNRQSVLGTARYVNGVEFRGLLGTSTDGRKPAKKSSKRAVP